MPNPKDHHGDPRRVPDVNFILDPGGLDPNSKSYGGRIQPFGALKVRRRGHISNQKCQRRYQAYQGRFRSAINNT